MRVTQVSRVFDGGAGYVADSVETSRRTQKFDSLKVVGNRFGHACGKDLKSARASAGWSFDAWSPTHSRKKTP